MAARKPKHQATSVEDIGAEIRGAGHGPPPSDGAYDVDEFNEEYAVVLIGSRCMILREFPDGAPHERMQLLSTEAFGAWNANRIEYVQNGKGEWKAVPKASMWLRDVDRRQYSGIVFEPDPGGPDVAAPAGTFNLWRGFEMERNRDGGDCSAFLDHLLERVCQGSEDLFHYLTAWFAHMVQRPRERIGTALVIRGGQGTGKTLIGQTIGSSNEDWVVPAGKDERRFAVFDIKDKAKGDSNYFSALFREVERPENKGALLDYLLEFDLSKIDLRDIPKTSGLFEQKVRSLDPVESWWLERLREGSQLPGADQWKDWVPTYRLHAAYIAFAERVGIKRRATETEFGIKLKKLVPGVVRKRKTEVDDQGHQMRSWGYEFPLLQTARSWLEASVGQSVNWEEEPDGE